MPSIVFNALPAITLVSLFVVERVWPLRVRTYSTWARWRINLSVALVGAVFYAIPYATVVLPAARFAEAHGIGLVRWLRLPKAAQVALSVVLLDYTLWLWHRLNHHVKFLWRFHAAHHADIELDASTALRFHFGELLLSAPFRVAQVWIIGASVRTLLAWETILLVFVLMHHSNTRLPLGLERVLRWLFVTPRLHGIHHSIEPREMGSNFGTLLTAWDVIHRTHRWDVPQETIAIGLPGARDLAPLGASLRLPFLPP